MIKIIECKMKITGNKDNVENFNNVLLNTLMRKYGIDSINKVNEFVVYKDIIQYHYIIKFKGFEIPKALQSREYSSLRNKIIRKVYKVFNNPCDIVQLCLRESFVGILNLFEVDMEAVYTVTNAHSSLTFKAIYLHLTEHFSESIVPSLDVMSF